MIVDLRVVVCCEQQDVVSSLNQAILDLYCYCCDYLVKTSDDVAIVQIDYKVNLKMV